MFKASTLKKAEKEETFSLDVSAFHMGGWQAGL